MTKQQKTKLIEGCQEYMVKRWQRMPQHAKSLLGLDSDIHSLTYASTLWEMQYWRAKALGEEVE